MEKNDVHRPDIGVLPDGIPQPALRALVEEGIGSLRQLTEHRARDLMKLHGVGPKAIRILEQALQAAGMDFADAPMASVGESGDNGGG